MAPLRRLVWIPLAVAAVALSGCFRMASLLTVHADGRATLVETLVVGAQARAFLGQMDSTDVTRPDAARLAARAALLGEGVTVADVAASDSGYTVTYAVADVRRLRFVPVEAPTDAQQPAGASDQTPVTFDFAAGADGVRTLTVRVPKETPAKPAASDTPAPDEAQVRESLAMARMMMGDARMTVRLAVDGRVVESTAPHRDGDAAVLYDVTMGAVLDLMAERPEMLRGAQPSAAELAAWAGGRDGLRLPVPGAFRVRFD